MSITMRPPLDQESDFQHVIEATVNFAKGDRTAINTDEFMEKFKDYPLNIRGVDCRRFLAFYIEPYDNDLVLEFMRSIRRAYPESLYAIVGYVSAGVLSL